MCSIGCRDAALADVPLRACSLFPLSSVPAGVHSGCPSARRTQKARSLQRNRHTSSSLGAMSSSDEEEQPQTLDPRRLPNYINPADVPALFWDELPDDEDNVQAAAIKAIIEESTPEERALSFKVAS